MKRFRFRLDTLLDYRNYLERRAQIELATAIREVERRKEEVNRISLQRREMARECDDASARGVDVPLYLMYRSYLQSLDDHLEKAHLNVKEGEERLLERRSRLDKETIKKKSLVSLKERQLEDHLMSSQRDEQKTMDELVLISGGAGQ
jgi:flagellar FliJ protein